MAFTMELAKGDRVALCGWDDFFGTVLEVIPNYDLDNDQVEVEWDRMNDDGDYVEWISPFAITRVEG